MRIIFVILLSFTLNEMFAQINDFSHSKSTTPISIDTLYDTEGNIEAYGEVRGEKRYGVWYFYLKNGKSYKTITYLENKEAVVKYYSDQKMTWGVEQDAILTSPYFEIENSKFYLSGFYNALYDKNYKITYHGISHTYYPTSGTIRVGKWENGKQNGEWIFRYPNGYVKNRKNFANGALNGKWETFYQEPIKQLWIEGQYKNNAKSGVWKMYYKNGQLENEGHFNEDIDAIYITSKNIDSLQKKYSNTELKYYQMAKLPFNFKSGYWKYYSKDGGLIKTEHYKNGELISTE